MKTQTLGYHLHDEWDAFRLELAGSVSGDGAQSVYQAWRTALSIVGDPEGVLGVKTYSHEVSGAYIFRVPLRKVTPFALAGAGALIFDPKDFTGASSQTRAAFVYGAGADFNLSRRVFVRAEYRGLVYNSPTYNLAAFSDLDRPARGRGSARRGRV